MTQHTTSRATRFLPQVVVATTVVAVLPAVVVWVLLIEGVISSPWVCLGLAIALSLVASAAGSAYWKRSGGHGDVLFSELLLWGWLHRYRAERRLASTVDRLGLSATEPGLTLPDGISTERKAQILGQMAAALDAQDPYTDGHSRRVALHAAMIARKMDLSGEEVAKVRTAAAVHDIGKLRTPPEVLDKPGVLTAAEFDVVKRHVEDGAEIVSVMEDPEITAIVRHHHERFDGHGYPDGLVGQQIPVAARIIAVADTFDALTSLRPYRAAVTHKKALATIVDASGTQLDPVAVRAFLKCYSGRRWVLAWTLLAASPQRAFTAMTGGHEGATNLGSAATTVAAPAALAAVVVAAVGTAGSVGRAHDALKLAQQPPAHVTAAQNAPTRSQSAAHRRASRSASRSADSPSSPATGAVLGTSSTRQRASTVPASPPSGASDAPRSRGGAGGSGAGNRGGAGTGGGPGATRGGGPRNGARGGTQGSPTHGGTGGTGVVSATQGTAPTPTKSGPPPSGGGSGGGAPGSGNGSGNPANGGGGSGSGSGSGNPANGGGGPAGGPGGSTGGPGGSTGGPGGSTGGPGGGNGSGSGGPGGGTSGGGGGGHPQSKADCMNGGFVNFGFRNQGQCIAWVEHNVIH